MKLWTDCIGPGSAIYDWEEGKSIIGFSWDENKWIDVTIAPNGKRFRSLMTPWEESSLILNVARALLKLNKKNGCLFISYCRLDPYTISIGLCWTKYAHLFVESGPLPDILRKTGSWPGFLPFWLFKGIKNKTYLKQMLQCEEVMHI